MNGNPQSARPRRKRSERFLAAVEPHPGVLILTHDNPDPDAVASGWALAELVGRRLGKPTRLVGGGVIVRAENRHMVFLLKPPLDLRDDLPDCPGWAVVLVDCGQQAADHLLAGRGAAPTAVIDHHEGATAEGAAFRDIRPRVAASATIAAGYLREQGLEPDARLATALLYAIRSETRGSHAVYSAADRAILPWLTRFADPGWLTEIENAPLPREYFSDLVLALQNTFMYADAAFCVLPRAAGPEVAGEVADLLIRCEDVHRVLCGALVNGAVVLSVRTDREGGDAAALLARTIRGWGRGGGHARRAGGKISGTANGQKVPEELHERLRARWLEVCGVRRRRGSRLVRLREIVKNL